MAYTDITEQTRSLQAARKQVVALQAENKRLKEALEKIMKYDSDGDDRPPDEINWQVCYEVVVGFAERAL